MVWVDGAFETYHPAILERGADAMHGVWIHGFLVSESSEPIVVDV